MRGTRRTPAAVLRRLRTSLRCAAGTAPAVRWRQLSVRACGQHRGHLRPHLVRVQAADRQRGAAAQHVVDRLAPTRGPGRRRPAPRSPGRPGGSARPAPGPRWPAGRCRRTANRSAWPGGGACQRIHPRARAPRSTRSRCATAFGLATPGSGVLLRQRPRPAPCPRRAGCARQRRQLVHDRAADVAVGRPLAAGDRQHAAAALGDDRLPLGRLDAAGAAGQHPQAGERVGDQVAVEVLVADGEGGLVEDLADVGLGDRARRAGSPSYASSVVPSSSMVLPGQGEGDAVLVDRGGQRGPPGRRAPAAPGARPWTAGCRAPRSGPPSGAGGPPTGRSR